jgi:hypothetical protein
VAFGPTLLAAVIVRRYAPDVPVAGVPDSKPEAEKVTPRGRTPVSLNEAAGKPVAVTVKLAAEPSVKIVAAALAMVGAC